MNLEGLLFFPVTPFRADGAVDLEVFGEHVRGGVERGAGAVFAACGTGEFAALDGTEIDELLAVAVAESAGRLPVFTGAGVGVGPACERIRRAAELGADGALLFPPSGAASGDTGYVGYVERVAAASPLPIIVYQRAGMILSVDAATRIAQLPQVIGLKDGSGKIELVQGQVRAIRAVREDFLFVNGLPTAEVTMPAYRAVGVERYSSAVFAFAPDVALAFHRAFTEHDVAEQQRLLDAFFLPLAQLRSVRPDYAISLVKAGVELRGLAVGSPRAPLGRPEQGVLDALEELLQVERGLVAVP
ncbi:5-dehydro-4-deoxyglucarate dehydratase [Agromyces sp. ISL-38]|uniref:5-dehydro-4-deoxyglucarate dehydratase n=1 Tax=Agromyces sp. ISL-38 TaxID=2819107 RepID=UPI001BE53E6A|nr:5-dehydro-4-deoxyglucarate dehydratase [Agromyces sp. ISL-38]MBT2497925.1 5-dehydro-4-deoxyglucarate dehydratase [Agromyces sp. ISL-38]